MVPNLLPIAIILGAMGYLEIPIDMANLLIASVALGIAVDDTIHYIFHFRVHHRQHGDANAAIAHSLKHSGRALVSTSIILSAGFFVFLSATMYSLQRFGALIGATVIIALLVDLILTPALLRTVFKTRSCKKPKEQGESHESQSTA
jgi:predicted RND superfamily exporter protein